MKKSYGILTILYVHCEHAHSHLRWNFFLVETQMKFLLTGKNNSLKANTAFLKGEFACNF